MIPVSDNLKNAVINEEKPKVVNIIKPQYDWLQTIDYFNIVPNPRPAGTRIVYGESQTSNDYVSLMLDDIDDANSNDWFGLRSLDFGAMAYTGFNVSIRFRMNSCELRRKSDGVWITTDRPTSARIRVYFRTENGGYSADGDLETVDDWWQISWQDNNHGCLLSRGVKYLSSYKKIKYISGVALRVYFDSSLYDGLIYDATLFDPMISAKSIPNYGFVQTTRNYNQYDTEDYLDYDFTTVDNSHIVSESFGYEESVCSADKLKLGGCESSKFEIQTFDDSNSYIGNRINLTLEVNSKGKFWFTRMIAKKVDKTSRGGTICKRVTAYDRLDRLSANAYAWYTKYMFGMNLIRDTQYRNYQFDYERQIFSAYWNLAKAFGIERESESITKTHLGTWTGYAYNNSYKFNNDYFGKDASNITVYCDYDDFTKGFIGDYQALMFKHTAFLAGRDWYKNDFDSLGRGVYEVGSLMVEFYDSNNNLLGAFLCDDGDIVLPPEGWDSGKIIFPTCWNSTESPSMSYITEGVAYYGVNFNNYDPYSIVNATAPLPYYSYVWRKPSITNIFTADSSITARDVMRSLMEMCGCFYRLSRDGKPQFIYAQEHGLYPSNDLYPADTLFPKKSGEMTMPTSYYISAEFAEFQVEKFGGVQVVVRTKDNTGAVVRWEYWEDDSSDSAYLIDDNIFLCAEEFLYDPQNTGNIDTLLENIFHCLDNLQYTPFTAETIGTPFLESGDRFTLLTQTDGFESFIFDRKLKGIQALKDHYEARGIAKTPRVKNFEWQQ